MLFNKLFGDKKPPKSPDASSPLNLERAISPWEAQNEETIDELANFIDFAEGFTIGFVEVSFPEDIDNLLKVLRLRPECRNVEFHVFDFSDPNLTYLKDELIQRINQLPQPFSTLLTPKRVILVKGLENSIGMFGDYPPVLQDLNFVRDALADSVQYPVLFCLPSYAINRVMKYAPDFWSWKSGVFRILANQDQQDEASIYALHAQKILGAANQLEKQERIQRLEKLAQEFDPLEANRNKWELRLAAQALIGLGQVHSYSGEFPKAQSSLAKVAPIFEKANWQPETQHDLKIRIEYLNWQAYLEENLGYIAPAQSLLEEAICLNNNIDLHQKRFSYVSLGCLKAHQGQVEAALALFQQALKIDERIGDAQGKAASLAHIGRIKQNQGQFEEALALFQRSLKIFVHNRNVHEQAASLTVIGHIKADRGQIEEALALFQQSLKIDERIGNFQGQATSLTAIGRIKADQGQFEEALTLLQRSLEIYKRIEDVKGQSFVLRDIGSIKSDQGQVEEALALFEQSLKIKQHIKYIYGQAVSFNDIGGIKADQGQLEEALVLHQQALEINKQIGDIKGQAVSQHYIANIKARQGEIDKAEKLYQAALQTSRHIDSAWNTAMTLGSYGKLLADHKGDFATAISYLQESLEIFQRIGSPKAAEVQATLERVQSQTNME